MPFSISAQSFVPASQHLSSSSPSGEWTVAAGEVPIAGAAAAGAQTQNGGTRRVVCSAFFQSGVCKDGDFCSFAHHLDELEVDAKVQLLSVLGDAVPIHFGGAGTQIIARTPPEHLAPRATPPSSGSRGFGSGVTNRRQTSWKDSEGPPQLSLGDEPIRVHLPARCRYPHAVSGTYYDYLNIKRCASHEVVEEAYRQWRSTGYRAAKAIDAVKADAIDRLVVDAKNVLSNPTMRMEYDVQLPTSSSTTPLTTPKKSAPSSNTANIAPPLSATMFEDLWR